MEWVTRETLKREWFFEERTGNCRLMAPLAAKLAETAPTWGRAVAPVAEWVAQSFWSWNRKPPGREKSLPTPLTQRRRSEARGKEFNLATTSAPRPRNVCAGCGVTTRVGQNCPKCGREVSRAKLIELAKVGRQVALSTESRKKHAETQKRHRAAQRAWLSSSNADWLTENAFKEKIQPRLASVPISSIASRIGISEVYAAGIRAGRHRPHPRHWQALANLAGVTRP